MVSGIVSSLIASFLIAVAALAWRNREVLPALSVALRPWATVRVSMSALLRIGRDDRYVLFHTPYTPGSYGPPGGVFKFRPEATTALDRLSFRADRRAAQRDMMSSDLRGFLPASALAPFLRWFDRGADRESVVECLRRELAEELKEVGHAELAPGVADLTFKPVRRVVEPPRKVPGKDFRQLRVFEVQEAVLADETAWRTLRRIIELAEDPNEQQVIMVSAQEIIEGRHGDSLIGPQSAFLFGTRRYRQDLPPGR
ncbi:hypothetical protein AB0G05_13255 [Nonomuraea wenchangensis]